jgi:hypothetical protein
MLTEASVEISIGKSTGQRPVPARRLAALPSRGTFTNSEFVPQAEASLGQREAIDSLCTGLI